MTRAVIAILGVLVLVVAGFALASGLSASATGAGRSPLAGMNQQTGSGSAATTGADQSGATTSTDADCEGDQHGSQPNGDSSHQFAPGSVAPDHKKKCPPPAVPEVPVAAGLLGLLGLIGLGFVVMAGRPRRPLSGSA